MSVDQYRRKVEDCQREIARIQKKKSEEVSKSSSETRRANEATAAARKSKTPSTAASKLRDAERHERAAADCQKRIAELESKLAREQSNLSDASRKLEAAQAADAKRRQQEQQRAEEAHRRTLRSMQGKLTEHAQLHRLAQSALEKLQQLPERVTVLFLAANPIDQQQLRLDEEVRAIGEMLRKSEHRDAVRLESRWAVRPVDVLQAINECRPRVVHFSGHGSDQDEIVFQDNAGNAKFVSKEAIVQTIAAGSDEIQLVFFNTCYSRQQAEAVVEHVPAAIGMKTSIGDEAARIFAGQFYSSIGFGHSVGRAFRQAQSLLKMESIPEEDTPELFMTEGLGADELILVRPAD